MAKKETGGRSKPNTIVLIIIVVLMLVLIGLFLGMAYYVFGGEHAVLGAKGSQNQGTDEEYTVILDEFIINLKSEGNTQHYLKATIALMYTDDEMLDLITANTNKLRDVIITNLRNKTAEEMLNNETSPQIKDELVSSLNSALNEDVISGIYFTDLVVQ